MSEQDSSNYYVLNKAKLIGDMNKLSKIFELVLYRQNFSQEDITRIMDEAIKEYGVIIPTIPYIGGDKNHLTSDLVGSAQGLALYKVLKSNGMQTEDIARIMHEFAWEYMNSFSRARRVLISLLSKVLFRKFIFKRIMNKRLKQFNEGGYTDNFVVSYVEGDGKEFDFGIDYYKCPVCKMYKEHGAGDILPYICLYDYISSSKLSRSGLIRTMTLAEGAEKCDFRFKRGREPVNKQKTKFLTDFFRKKFDEPVKR